MRPAAVGSVSKPLAIAGAGTVTKDGDGTLVLVGNLGSYNGTIQLKQGNLGFGSAPASLKKLECKGGTLLMDVRFVEPHERRLTVTESLSVESGKNLIVRLSGSAVPKDETIALIQAPGTTLSTLKDAGRITIQTFGGVTGSHWVETSSGVQTLKFKADGFLYYCTTKWNGEHPIEKGPFTDWDACSLANYHGDGQWTCCGGPDVLPLATIRLENFRDGLDDLWYAKLLEQKLREVESGKLKVKSEEWAKRAHEALAVPTDLVRSTMDFSIDPNVLYRWRDKMADLIEATK